MWHIRTNSFTLMARRCPAGSGLVALPRAAPSAS
jgi:hypothetical protein